MHQVGDLMTAFYLLLCCLDYVHRQALPSSQHPTGEKQRCYIVNQASVLMSNPISRAMFAVGVQNLCSRFFCFFVFVLYLYADDQHMYTLAN